MLIFWNPGSALRPRNDDLMGINVFFNDYLS